MFSKYQPFLLWIYSIYMDFFIIYRLRTSWNIKSEADLTALNLFACTFYKVRTWPNRCAKKYTKGFTSWRLYCVAFRMLCCLFVLETHAEPSLQATQMRLKRARLADDLNEKIAQRPGPMELVEKNILPVDVGKNEDYLIIKMALELSWHTHSHQEQLW